MGLNVVLLVLRLVGVKGGKGVDRWGKGLESQGCGCRGMKRALEWLNLRGDAWGSTLFSNR